MKSANILKILAQVLDEGGAIVNVETEALVFPNQGYAVALNHGVVVPCASRSVRGITSDEIVEAITQVAEARSALRTSDGEIEFIGFWLDGGKLYVDPVVILSNVFEAVNLGRVEAQKAIYDFAGRESIELVYQTA